MPTVAAVPHPQVWKISQDFHSDPNLFCESMRKIPKVAVNSVCVCGPLRLYII